MGGVAHPDGQAGEGEGEHGEQQQTTPEARQKIT
jgi:hypothetical protein